MVRKRTQLLSLFPPDQSAVVVTPSEASDALRKCHGNLDEAYQFLLSTKIHEEEKGKENDTNAKSMKDDKGNDDNDDENDSKISPPAVAGAIETAGKASMKNPSSNNNDDDNQISISISAEQEDMVNSHRRRSPPNYSVTINNLSDRQYCCVWWVEVIEDGYRSDIARNLLARVAQHVNPILRHRGWRVSVL